MIHPHTELRHISDTVGNGLFATSFIPRGTLVYVKDELELVFAADDERVKHPIYGPIIERYSYRDPQGQLIMSWDLARFENHSCEPNTLSTGYGFEIAIRDIQAGEQVTDDYGMFNMEYSMACECGSDKCRQRISGGDLDKLHPLWDSQVKAAMACIDQVPQPLMMLVEGNTYLRLYRYLNTGKGYRSVKSLKYRQSARTSRRAGQMAMGASS